MDLYSKARDAQERGAYRKAAEYWAHHSFSKLVEEHFEHTRRTRIGVAIMLRAISCDTRAGNTERAKSLFNIVQPVLDRIREAADDEVVAGLASEWLGDGCLMLGDEAALNYYREAKDLYEGNVAVDEPWGYEEEFDQAYWAFESFLDSNGYSLPEHSEFQFMERIERKLEIAGELLTLKDNE